MVTTSPPLEHRRNVEQAIAENQLSLLVDWPDSHIVRRCGQPEAIRVRNAAFDIGNPATPEGRRKYLAFDAWLRSDNHARNPGTTADLIAAELFIALRERRIAPDTPFTWREHPFQENLFANASGSDVYNHPS